MRPSINQDQFAPSKCGGGVGKPNVYETGRRFPGEHPLEPSGRAQAASVLPVHFRLGGTVFDVLDAKSRADAGSATAARSPATGGSEGPTRKQPPHVVNIDSVGRMTRVRQP